MHSHIQHHSVLNHGSKLVKKMIHGTLSFTSPDGQIQSYNVFYFILQQVDQINNTKFNLQTSQIEVKIEKQRKGTAWRSHL